MAKTTGIPEHIVKAARQASGVESSPQATGRVGVSPRIAARAQKIFLGYTEEVARYFMEVVRDDSQKTADRISAGKEIFDRGMGKSVNTLQMNLETNPTDMLDPEKVDQLSDEQLQRFMEMVEQIAHKANGGDLLDVTPNDENES